MPTLTRRWSLALAAGAAIGIIAWLSNLTTEAQMLGEDRIWWGTRTFVSRVVNSGTVWAGLPVLAGRIMRRPGPAALAGVLVSEAALVVHYAVGSLTGTMPWSIWGNNLSWFVIALLLCAPLGLIGALTHHLDTWGLLARLVVPAGAVMEVATSHFFDSSAGVDTADRWASAGAGLVLLGGGLLGGTFIVRRWWARRSHH